jgi:hypothetical protein
VAAWPLSTSPLSPPKVVRLKDCPLSLSLIKTPVL